MAIEIADIVSEFGAYYIPGGENESRLYTMLMQPTETEKYLTTIVTDATLWKGSKVTVDGLIQSFQRAWSPKGTVTFTPLSIQNRHHKMDNTIFPDDVEATWLGFLADNSLSREEWPLVRYLIEKVFVPKMKEEWELNEVYKGVYQDPTPGVASSPGTLVDGLGKIIADGIADSKVNLVAVGALTDASIVDQVNDFADGITGPYEDVPMNIFMSKANKKRYLRRKKELEGGHMSYEKGSLEVDFTNKNIIALASMTGKDRFFASPAENMVRLNKKTDNMNKFKIEERHREVSILTDWWDAPGFVIAEQIWATEND